LVLIYSPLMYILMVQLKPIFHFLLLGALLISFYFFIDTLVFKNAKYRDVFSTWQFPMLLAIYLDTIYKL
jgi:hypothetical protein